MKSHEFSDRSMADGGQKDAGAMVRSPEVEVLLATYNGERFLRAQVDSILSQDYENLRVLARDDGSSDGTTAILKEYERRFPDRFHTVPPGAPTGNAKDNFLLLMKAANAEYVCFSDQDDLWLPDKVSRTMQAMGTLESRHGTDTPLLVFTDLRVVDDGLKPLHESFWRQTGTDPELIHRLAAVLVHNPVTGCTMLINRPLLDMAVKMPGEAAMHDSWIALLASGFGASEAVQAKTVLYRQHDRNVIGVDARRRLWREQAERFFQGEGRALQWERNARQAEALLRIHREELSRKHLKLIEAYLRCGRSRSRVMRVATMLRYRFFRPGFARNAATLVDLWRAKTGQEST
jgi:glycosyltransferase involved in cell wall biosynthesis